MAGIIGSLYGFDYYYSASFTDSFYTAFPGNEINLFNYSLQASNYFYLFVSQRPGTVRIYRYYDSDSGDHFYTTSGSTPGGYISEGVVGWGFTSAGSNRVAIYRWYRADHGDHRYTTSSSTPSGYVGEGIEWYSPVVVNGCSDPVASNYNPDVNQTSSGCTYSPPTVSFSASPSAIIRGSSSTLSWSVTGVGISSISINQGIGSVSTSSTRSVSPTTTTTYTLTATGLGGTTTRSVTITVYQPPNVTLSLNNPTIIRGQSTTLNWVTTGDAGSASITPGIGAVNINGNRIVSPTETTTYVINVSGLGGSDSDSITLLVYQPPTVNLTGPASINYEQQGTLTYSSTNVDISLTITPTYNYKNTTTTGVTINLPISNNPGGIQINIPYNDFGPTSVTYVIVATGNGGQESKQLIIPINIDETPTNFLIPESEDLLKSQEPIVTPDAVVTSYEIVIDDVDIPVEIKADRPILVEINNTDTWIPIREI
jgi:hypothetical protein